MDPTFTLLPLHLDPSSKAISAPTIPNPSLHSELTLLNTTHRALLTLDNSAGVPPPPVPLNPKRSAAIQKMREQGNASMGKKNTPASSQTHIQEAIKYYTYALEMALGRPMWEPGAIVREEVSVLLSNRAQAYMGMQMWPEGAADAATSVEMKPAPGNGKAWWRRGKCLAEMGRWDEAAEWIARAVEADGTESADLKSLRSEVEQHLRTGNGKS